MTEQDTATQRGEVGTTDGYGLMLSAVVAALGHVSGAHVYPAITITGGAVDPARALGPMIVSAQAASPASTSTSSARSSVASSPR